MTALRPSSSRIDASIPRSDLWGANYFPGAGPEGCLELTALINIRPAQGNRGMVVQAEAVAAKMRAIVADLVGRGELL